jgi:MoaA/NifB/PqqE/SkfB family radical SAM enzyme
MELYEEKLHRISLWLKNKIAPPFKAVIIPTNRCNLKCSFCPNALPRSKGIYNVKDEVKDEKWVEVVKEGLSIGIREWSIIGGGEPLLRHKAAISMIETIKAFNGITDCELITNGTLFQKKDIKNLVMLRLDRIIFSIDAPDTETHDHLRGVNGAFTRAIGNLKSFVEWKQKLKLDKPYLKVNMVLNKKNFKKILKMVKFLSKIKVQELALHSMRIYWELGNGIKSLVLSPLEKEKLKMQISKAQLLARKLGLYLNTDMVELTPEEHKQVSVNNALRVTCFEPLYSLLITPEGYVGKCAPSGSGLKELNVNEKSLKEIWYSKELNDIRKMILAGKTFDSCSKCGLVDMKIHLANALKKRGLI